MLALRDEPGLTGAEPLLEPVMRDGVRAASAPSIEEMRARFDADLAALPATAPGCSATRRRSRFDHSEALVALTASTRDEALRRSGADDGSR